MIRGSLCVICYSTVPSCMLVGPRCICIVCLSVFSPYRYGTCHHVHVQCNLQVSVSVMLWCAVYNTWCTNVCQPVSHYLVHVISVVFCLSQSFVRASWCCHILWCLIVIDHPSSTRTMQCLLCQSCWEMQVYMTYVCNCSCLRLSLCIRMNLILYNVPVNPLYGLHDMVLM